MTVNITDPKIMVTHVFEFPKCSKIHSRANIDLKTFQTTAWIPRGNEERAQRTDYTVKKMVFKRYFICKWFSIVYKPF